MNESIRVRTNVGAGKDKYVNFQLNQDFDFIEILSLKLRQADLYRLFASDYGVVVGRVIANSGFGVPNARVSIFIPISDEDKENEVVKGLYPYGLINDKDANGSRYNLLPKNSSFDCHSPVGNLPNKREILDNDVMIDVYEDYYKFTTRTNAAGDFMIFGVPTGNWKVNIDIDLSDIGTISQKPYDFIRQGKDKKEFETNNKFKKSNNLNDLQQIFHTETSVDVLPFWGDKDSFQVGINRVDVEISHRIEPQAFFIGSTFGDNEKNSVAKRCGVRKKLGNLCETVSAEGTVEMIRRNSNGAIENFTVNGGRVIDSDGAWAYQIPMNLNYVVTDEFGNLVPTEDETKGIPTKASVRFRIGMDVNGEEGRLRRRAKYLVPNNPDGNGGNYDFDETTPNSEFRDLHWNKIYTVKNFIPRFQTDCATKRCGTIRRFTGIKDVDDCGDHVPFPYNRMDTDINPLYIMICVILTVIAYIVAVINNVIRLINEVLKVINSVVFWVGKIVCYLDNIGSSNGKKNCRRNLCARLGGNCSGSCYSCNLNSVIAYITLDCDGNTYLPYKFGDNNQNCSNLPSIMRNWCNDNGVISVAVSKYVECQRVILAEALDVFELDFYNDWINGSLFSFLFKQRIKKRGEGKNKFCDYDCDEFSDPTDNDEDGDADNSCRQNWIVDTCGEDAHFEISHKAGDSASRYPIREGIIRLYKDEYYYAASTHNGYPLFKTDLVLLGSINSCDVNGIPLIYDKLTNTSYRRPPTSDTLDDNTVTVSNIADLLYEIDCLGIQTEQRHCWNIRKICEIGVGLDEERDNGGTSSPANDRIGNEDIEDSFLRNSLTILNEDITADIDSVGESFQNNVLSYNTKFGNSSPTNGSSSTMGSKYYSFRDFQGGGNSPKLPWGNSYFYYFGINPGKTGLDKLYSEFVEPCTREQSKDLELVGSTTAISNLGGNNGTLTVNVLNGLAPYNYTVLLTDGTTLEFLNEGSELVVTGLISGTYNVIVEDSTGVEGTIGLFVNEPTPISLLIDMVPTTNNATANGQLVTSFPIGGIEPYDICIVSPSQGGVGTCFNNVSVGETNIFTALAVGSYTIRMTDSSPINLVLDQVINVTEPTPISIEPATTSEITCAGFFGHFNLNITGGVPPYEYNTVGADSGIEYDTLGVTGPAQTYNISVSDSIGQTATDQHVLTEGTTINIPHTVYRTCGVVPASARVFPSGGVPPYTYEWRLTNQGNVVSTTDTLNNWWPGEGNTIQLSVEDSTGCGNVATFYLLSVPDFAITLNSVFGTLMVNVQGNSYAKIFTIQYHDGDGDWATVDTLTTSALSFNRVVNNLGYYRILGLDTNECTAISNTKIVTV